MTACSRSVRAQGMESREVHTQQTRADGEERSPKRAETTPRCPDNRRKFRLHGRKPVVFHNIMIAAVLMDPFFFRISIPYTSVLYKVEGTQYKICCFPKHDSRCAAVEPLFPLPTCPCIKMFTLVCQNINTAVLLWQPADISY